MRRPQRKVIQILLPDHLKIGKKKKFLKINFTLIKLRLKVRIKRLQEKIFLRKNKELRKACKYCYKET